MTTELTVVLTPKQEAFAQAIFAGKTQNLAYRESYDASGMTENAINVEASRLMDHPKVSLRIQQLRDDLAFVTGRNLAGILRQIDVIKTMALTSENPQLMVVLKALEFECKVLKITPPEQTNVTANVQVNVTNPMLLLQDLKRQLRDSDQNL